MLDLIFIILIFVWIYKKSTQSINLYNLLQQNGFKNISTIKSKSSSNLISANLHNDTYILLVMANNIMVSTSAVTSLMEFAIKGHYHNVIIIPGNSGISDLARQKIAENNIQILSIEKLKNNIQNPTNDSSSQKNNIVSKPTSTSNYKATESNDPIKNGTKANSIFGNLFGNKVEKL